MTEALKTATPIRTLPGIALAAAVGVAAILCARALKPTLPLSEMVVALLIGIGLNRIAMAPAFQPGLQFCVRTLLRIAVALLGIRIALADIAALGWHTAAMVIAAMALTIVSAMVLAKALGRSDNLGALAGVGTAVCGASATLATAAILPAYPRKQADVVFVVVAVNALSTVAMIVYPPVARLAGFDDHTAGILFGATIHDVAQVVGAGYSVSERAGNTAVIVKLFRVALLLPVVMAVGWWFARRGLAAAGRARIPVPLFAVFFLLLCIANSFATSSGLAPHYAPLKAWVVEASTFGLVIAISALGLQTSLTDIRAIGWHAPVLVVAITLLLLAFCMALLAAA